MANTQSDHWGYRLGLASVRAFGQMSVWVKYLALVMRRKGIPDGLAQVLAWIAVIAVVGASFYVLFWLTLIVVVVLCAVLVVSHLSPQEATEWHVEPRRDHRDSPFYHPDAFTDDPDPRFDDEHR
jgi:fatty acid desaturase